MVSSVYIVALWIQRTGEFECCPPGKAFVSRTNLMILTPHEETQPQPADRRCIVARQLGGLWEGAYEKGSRSGSQTVPFGGVTRSTRYRCLAWSVHVLGSW